MLYPRRYHYRSTSVFFKDVETRTRLLAKQTQRNLLQNILKLLGGLYLIPLSHCLQWLTVVSVLKDFQFTISFVLVCRLARIPSKQFIGLLSRRHGACCFGSLLPYDACLLSTRTCVLSILLHQSVWHAFRRNWTTIYCIYPRCFGPTSPHSLAHTRAFSFFIFF